MRIPVLLGSAASSGAAYQTSVISLGTMNVGFAADRLKYPIWDSPETPIWYGLKLTQSLPLWIARSNGTCPAPRRQNFCVGRVVVGVIEDTLIAATTPSALSDAYKVLPSAESARPSTPFPASSVVTYLPDKVVTTTPEAS